MGWIKKCFDIRSRERRYRLDKGLLKRGGLGEGGFGVAVWICAIEAEGI